MTPREIVMQWYDTTRHPEHEPTWHLFEDMDDEFFETIQKEMMGRNPKLHDDGSFGGRIIDNGYKVGTPSWVFLGRNDTSSTVYRWSRDPHWIVCCRRPSKAIQKLGRKHGFPDLPEFWIAYHLENPMGDSTFTANCIGTCLLEAEVLEQLADQLEQQP